MMQNTQALWYVISQMAAKGTAAVAQLYAVYVFIRIHAPNDAALIFMLFGYGMWIQIFEFGVSQQNSLNSKALSVSGSCEIIALHYVLMIIFPEVLDPFREERRAGQILENAHSYTS